MPDEPVVDELAAELVAVGRALRARPAPDPAAVAGAVRRRLAERPGPYRPRLRYAAAAAAVGVAVLLAGSAQVRAAVVDFFRFGGVVVEHGSPTTDGPRPSATAGAVVVDGVEAARARVGFPVLVPAALGRPDEVSVLDARVVSFTYQDARLDQFDGTLDPAFAKTVPNQDAVRWVEVDGQPALWLPGPHELVYLDRAGQRHTESARLAAATLVWQRGGVTMRLEGAFTAEQAVAVARSMG